MLNKWSPLHFPLFILIAVLLLTNSFLVEGLLDPCPNSLINAVPSCGYPAPKLIDQQLNTLSKDSILSASVANAYEEHFLLVKSEGSSILRVIKYKLSSYTQFNHIPLVNGTDIKNDCSTNGEQSMATIEGETIRFIDSSSQYLAVSGWFNAAVGPVCIGSFNVSQSNTLTSRTVPFIATISSQTGSVISVQSFEQDFVNYQLSGYDIDQSTGNLYVMMQNSKELVLGAYQKTGKLIYQKKIGNCTNHIQILALHYSELYDKIIIPIMEKEPRQMTIAGNSKVYTDYKSAYWSVILNPSDGSHINTNRVFHSSLISLPTPKLQFDSLGFMYTLLVCEDGCYLSGVDIDPNIYLFKYHYMETKIHYSKTFISNFIPISFLQTCKIHSLQLERDDTLNAVIEGGNSPYLIKESMERQFQANSSTTFNYRFRKSDYQIIAISPLPSGGENFIVSVQNQLVNINQAVTEMNPILFVEPEKEMLLLRVISYIYSGDRKMLRSLVVRNGTITGPVYQTTGYLSSYKYTYSQRIILKLIISDGSSIVILGKEGYHNTYSGSDFFSFNTYVKQWYSPTDGSNYYLEIGNEKSKIFFGDTDVRIETLQLITTEIPYGLDFVGFVNPSTTKAPFQVEVGYSLTFSCLSGWGGDNCERLMCFGKDYNDRYTVCNNNGRCVDRNKCECRKNTNKDCSATFDNYYCSNNTSPFNNQACNGGGSCQITKELDEDDNYYSVGICTCFKGYSGKNCETPSNCFGIQATNRTVCSRLGSCVGTDQCSCDSDHSGPQCQFDSCFGISANSTSVCSSYGSCVAPNKCICKEGYTGQDCSTWSCFGKTNTYSYSSPVCSGLGSCVDIDTCKCISNYFGTDCSNTTCNGVKNDNELVCGGRGTCKIYEKCECKNSHGKYCDTCNDGYFGNTCNEWTCNGIHFSNESACNYRGVCDGFNKCTCSRSSGVNCETCESRYMGKTCSECVTEGVYGADCTTLYDHNIPYLEAIQPGYVGFKIRTFFQHSQDYSDSVYVGCEKFLQDIQKVALDSSAVRCKVVWRSNSNEAPSVYDVSVEIEKEKAIFTPQDTIMFNIEFGSNSKPIYIPLQLNYTNFDIQYSNTAGNIYVSNARKHSDLLNRCYENVISLHFIRLHGPIRSIIWQFEGDSISLYNISIIRDAIQRANTSSWIMPYFKELKYYSKVELSVKIDTYFNITLNYTAVLGLDASFPRHFRKTPFTFKLVERTIRIPLSNFFSENFECIDGTTWSFYILLSSVNVEITNTEMVVSPKTYSKNHYFTVVFNDWDYKESLDMELILNLPTVYIKETVISPSSPYITIVCNPFYGAEPPNSKQVDFVWIMQGRTAVAKSIYEGPVVMDVRQFNPPLDMSRAQVLGVACMRSYDDFHGPMYYLPGNYFVTSQVSLVGKSETTLYFVERAEPNGCKVLSSRFNTKISNVIPFTDSLDLMLEITTTQSINCKVEVSIVEKDSKLLVETVVTNSTKIQIPLQKSFKTLKFKSKSVMILGDEFQISAIGSGDSTDHIDLYTIQEKPSSALLLSCSITPNLIQIGFTTAKLNCISDGDYYNPYLKYTLKLNDLIFNSGFRKFPIDFKPLEAISKYVLLLSDSNSGGEDILPLTFRDVEYSTSELFTNEAVESMSLDLSTSNNKTIVDEYFKKNDLVVTLVSNVHMIQNDSVLSGMSKLVPLALSATAKSLSTQFEKAKVGGSSISSDDMVKYINQVKVLSIPQFLNPETAAETVEVLNKFVDMSKQASIWSTSSSITSLSDILVNVAPKISQHSVIKTSVSIVNSAITLGSKSELTTVDFFPNEKPSNLAEIRAVKVVASLLKNFYSGNSMNPLIKFDISSSNDSFVTVSNSVFKFPNSSTTRMIHSENQKEFISYLSISKMEGTAHVNIPIPSFVDSSDSSTMNIFQCSVTFDNVNFESESYCKAVNSSFGILPSLISSQSLIVDCLCDLTLLSSTLTSGDSIGITAQYFTQKVQPDLPNIENNPKKSDDNSGVAAIVIIPIFIWCFCFVAIPSTVIFILVREIKKRGNNSNHQTESNRKQPVYKRVITDASIDTSNVIGITLDPKEYPKQEDTNNIDMKTFNTFNANDVPNTTI